MLHHGQREGGTFVLSRVACQGRAMLVFQIAPTKATNLFEAKRGVQRGHECESLDADAMKGFAVRGAYAVGSAFRFDAVSLWRSLGAD